MYQIIAQITRKSDEGWTTSQGVPTFFLDSEVQGIVNAQHAAGIARVMLRDLVGNEAKISGTAYNKETDDYATL